ncbi:MULTISPECIES: helix-turn-helix domain-containing protein [Rudanella]|nr:MULTISPECIES: AraC family transcriptional regulator [Rudanella]
MFDTETVLPPAKAYSAVPFRVKGMVCQRCVEEVRSELTKAGFSVLDVRLGYVSVQGPLTADKEKQISKLLASLGFGVLETSVPLPQQVKDLVAAYFAQSDLSEIKSGNTGGRLSVQLQEALKADYATISSQFAKEEGITLEKYIIRCRLNKVKEWLVYSGETLTEIAYRTGYSSVQHLSNQFRQQTGLTPSHFRQLRRQKQELQSSPAQSTT